MAELNPQIPMTAAAELEANNSSHGPTSGRKVRVARVETPFCSVKPLPKGMAGVWHAWGPYPNPPRPDHTPQARQFANLACEPDV